MKHRRTVILNAYRELPLGHTPQTNRLEWFSVIFFYYSFNYTFLPTFCFRENFFKRRRQDKDTRSGEKTLTVSSVYIQHTEPR